MAGDNKNYFIIPQFCRCSRPEVFLRKGILKSKNMQQIYSKFTEESLCQSVISIKLQSNFIEIILHHGYSSVNLQHVFIIPFPKNTSGRLLIILFFWQVYENSFHSKFSQASILFSVSVYFPCFSVFYNKTFSFEKDLLQFSEGIATNHKHFSFFVIIHLCQERFYLLSHSYLQLSQCKDIATKRVKNSIK